MRGLWKNSICSAPSSVNLGNPQDYVVNNSFINSPIDEFYIQQKNILSLCSPDFFSNHPSIAPLMLIGLVSNVEAYYREIFAHTIKICPIARKNASSKSVNLSSIYFGQDFLELSTFEHISLSDAQMISKFAKLLFNIDINDNKNSINPPLIEFQKLIELRHSIVHSRGMVNSKNAIELDLPASKKHYKVKVNYGEIQNSALICTSLVCASNIEFFTNLVNKWAINWRILPNYNSSGNYKKFKHIWDVFKSKIDETNNNISNNTSLIKTKNIIEKEFNL